MMKTPDHDLSQPAVPGAAPALSIDWIIRICVLGALLYWSIVLVRPFLTIVAWSVVLTVALYPAYSWLARKLGGRRRLAAALLTLLCLAIVIGPATWLVLGLIDSLRFLSDWLDPKSFSLPPPPARLQTWPLIGDPAFQFWNLASTNLSAALAKIAPQIKPV